VCDTGASKPFVDPTPSGLLLSRVYDDLVNDLQVIHIDRGFSLLIDPYYLRSQANWKL